MSSANNSIEYQRKDALRQGKAFKAKCWFCESLMDIKKVDGFREKDECEGLSEDKLSQLLDQEVRK
jgi:hypothetical protein